MKKTKMKTRTHRRAWGGLKSMVFWIRGFKKTCICFSRASTLCVQAMPTYVPATIAFRMLLQPAAYRMRDSDHRVPYRLLLESATLWMPKQPPSIMLSKPVTRHRVEDIMEDVSDNNRFAARNRIDQWNAFYRHIDCAIHKAVVL